MAFKGISPETLAVYMRTPVGKPTPGQTANFAHPPRLKSALIGVTVPLFVLTTVFVAIRVYTRSFVIKHLWWDDCKSTIKAFTHERY